MRFFAFGVFTAALLLTTLGRTPAADDTPDQVGGKTLDDWLKQSKSFDPSVRENSIRAMMQFGKDARKALPTVIALMGDADVGVSTVAVSAFRAIANEKDVKGAVPSLTKVLQSGRTTASIQAAMALGALGPDAKAAIKPLSDLARASSSWELRKTAVLALGSVAQSKEGPDTPVIRALVESFSKDKEPCSQVRMAALMSIGMLQAHKSSTGAPIVKHPLDLAIRSDSDQLVGVWARVLQAQMQAQAEAKPDQNITFLVNQMQKNPDPLVRANALQGLAVLGPLARAYIPNIIRMLADKDMAVSGVAASALGQIRELLNDRQIADIAKMLDGGDAQTRAHSAAALAYLGPEKAKRFIPELINLLKDDDAGPVAANALVQLKTELTEKHLGDIAALLADKDPGTRCQAARAIALLTDKGKPRIPDLITILDDKDAGVVCCAIIALASFGKDADKAVPALTKLRDHKDDTVKDLAAKAIDQITGKALK